MATQLSLDTTDLAVVQERLTDIANKGMRGMLSCRVIDLMCQPLIGVTRLKATPPIVEAIWMAGVTLSCLLGIQAFLGEVNVNSVLQVATATGSFLAIVFTIKLLYPMIVPEVIAISIATAKSPQALYEIELWFRAVLNVRRQLIFSLALCAISVGVLAWYDGQDATLSITPLSYISLGLTFASGANLLFLGVAPPLLLRLMSRHNLSLFAFDPAHDKSVTRLADLVSLMLVMGGLIVLVFVAVSYFVFVVHYSAAVMAVVMVAWYVLGLTAALVLFSFSNFYLTQMIRRAKRKLLADLRARIDRLYETMGGEIDPEKLANIEKAFDFYRALRDSRDSSINWPMVRSLFSSILLQTLPLAVGFVDWQNFASSFYKVLGIP